MKYAIWLSCFFNLLSACRTTKAGFGVDSGISGGELSERFTVLSLCFKEARKLANDDSVKCDLVVNNEGKLTLKFK